MSGCCYVYIDSWTVVEGWTVRKLQVPTSEGRLPYCLTRHRVSTPTRLTGRLVRTLTGYF